MSTDTSLAHDIYRRSHLTGEFTLRSGVVAHEYFDKYLFESDPVMLRRIAEAMAPHIPAHGVDALAGLETGGIPLAVMLSQVTGIPALFVRKEAKTYGTCRLAEGGEVEGRHLFIVEDVVTSGGAVLDAVAELRQRGATVKQAVCVIDREAGGPKNLADNGIGLKSLFTMTELKAAGEK
ncbi:orotate phosphoribosyltransferase [Glycomyces sp. L485]|uniref:orotate phosphoribosyltransferase n=1 Tax=Glycomyces sp. L485 TaxID=2909235 RepID=UPI001F4B85E7|nr:orotate phosphoribosyltransferase [Glycomyces sp. L485]MCH7233031.1 orotate phosphoribosyltransferase [Glycomyces sp. L485]